MTDHFDEEIVTEESVRVFVRIRPLNKRELAEKQTIGWAFNDTAMLEDTPNGQRVYAYDHCFGPQATNQETYEIVGRPIVLKAMEGYNGTVFTYGQTGSGKTWTMRGSPSDPGMMVLCVRDLLDCVKTMTDLTFTLKVAYLEVYNEEINDLLGEPGPNSKNLKIVSEDATRGAVIGNLVELPAETSEDFMNILLKGEASRSYASTNMNEQSSRSHTIYRVSIEARRRDAENDAPPRVSYLNLVDLAGSERQKSTKAEGKVLKEGANINRSLLALGAVINKLGEFSKKNLGKSNKPAYIPYRDSKLTRILKQSLGGNTMTSVLCAVTPAPIHREETVSTLKFGQLCKSIKNTVKSNDGLLDDKALIKQYRVTINELRAQIDELQAENEVSKHNDRDLLQQKNQLEQQLRSLEAIALNHGVSALEIQEVLEIKPNSEESETGISVGREELHRLHEKISEQAALISSLQAQLGEYQDLEELKASIEDYEANMKNEIDEESNRIAEEKNQVQSEKFKLLKDRSSLEERESRVSLLLAALDEKESKLRQIQASLRDQQALWQRSVNDLQKREDLVNDWENTHRQREQKIAEREAFLDKKHYELSQREMIVKDEENKSKTMSLELAEREQRLQIGMSRVANQEQANSSKEESLLAFEASLKRKETEGDIRERELAGRRKELESWDVLLREKDRKITQEQNALEIREHELNLHDDKVKDKEREVERHALENKQLEASLRSQQSRCETHAAELETKEKEQQLREREAQNLLRSLHERENDLKQWEERLVQAEIKYKNLNHREETIKQAEQQLLVRQDKFYNVDVLQITTRHLAEVRRLQEQIDVQLRISTGYEAEFAQQNEEIEKLKNKINDLKEQLEDQKRNNLMMQNEKQNEKQNEVSPANQTHEEEENEATENPPETAPNSFSSAASIAASSICSIDPTINTATNTLPQSPIDSQSQAPNNPSTPQFNQFIHPSTSVMNDFMMKRNNLIDFNGPASVGTTSLPPNEFIAQLSLTRKAIYNVLEKYNALPEGDNVAMKRQWGHILIEKWKERVIDNNVNQSVHASTAKNNKNPSEDSSHQTTPSKHLVPEEDYDEFESPNQNSPSFNNWDGSTQTPLDSYDKKSKTLKKIPSNYTNNPYPYTSTQLFSPEKLTTSQLRTSSNEVNYYVQSTNPTSPLNLDLSKVMRNTHTKHGIPVASVQLDLQSRRITRNLPLSPESQKRLAAVKNNNRSRSPIIGVLKQRK